MIDMDELSLKQEALRRAVEHQRDRLTHGFGESKAEEVVESAKAFEAFLRG